LGRESVPAHGQLKRHQTTTTTTAKGGYAFLSETQATAGAAEVTIAKSSMEAEIRANRRDRIRRETEWGSTCARAGAGCCSGVQRGRRRRRKTHAHLGLERRSKSGGREGAARGGGGRKETLEGTPRERGGSGGGALPRF